MEEIITKKIADELIKMECQARGHSIKVDLNYVLFREGQEGIKKMEKAMADLGYPIKYNQIEIMKLYPLGLQTIIILVMAKLFGYKKEDFEKVGEFTSKMPFIMRLFMRYLVSIDMVAKYAQRMWNTHYTRGKIEIIKLDKEKKHIIVRISEFKTHPFHCIITKSYIAHVIKMAVKASIISHQETKCPFLGDDYHELLVKWN